MAKRIRVKGIPRPEPDVRRYAMALIELARQLQEEDNAAKKQAEASAVIPEGLPHD
jgi:hypothetical protein